MRLSLKINFLLIAIVVLFNSCTVSGPFQPQVSRGKIHGDQLVVGNSFLLSSDDSLEGNIVGIGASLVIEKNAKLKGDISLLGGTVDIMGSVDGTINNFAGVSHIYQSATINGDINQYLNEAIIDTGAQIIGEINTFTFPRFPSQPISEIVNFLTGFLHPQKLVGFQLAHLIFYSTLSVIAMLIFKKRISNVVIAVQKQAFASWFFGVLSAIIIPLVGILLILTFCLSPVGILVIILQALLTYMGWIVMGVLTGKVVQHWLHTKWSEELQAFLGSLIFGLTTSLLNWLPCIGWTITFCLGITGLGGLFLSRFGVPLSSKKSLPSSQQPASENITNQEEKPNKKKSKS